MKRMSALLAVAVSFAGVLHAQVPHMIHYQGRIVAGTTNFEGTGLFKFALVSTNGAGGVVTLWSNNGSSAEGSEPSAAVGVPVVKGLYSVLLGDPNLPNMQSLSPAVFSSAELRLRVWFNDGASGFQQITPDQRIASVGFAMVAGTVPDAAVTPPKLSPGTPGQVLMTDSQGRANWAPAADVVAHASSDDPDSVAIADPVENTALIHIEGLFTNEVVICGGLSVELDTSLYSVNGPSGASYVWEVPQSSRVNEYSKFIFECAGSATNLLAAETNAYPRVARDIAIIVRNSLGVEKCRWTLPKMVFQRVLRGSGERARFVCAPSSENMYSEYGRAQVAYQRTPETQGDSGGLRAGYDDLYVELEGIGVYVPSALDVNPRERTITLTVESGELGNLYRWFNSVSHQTFWYDMELKACSILKLLHLPGGGVQESYRNNYFEAAPVRYEVVTGFGQFERLKERVVIKYVFRQRG